MDRLRVEIHAAFLNVTYLCDQFFRKFPSYAFAPTNNGYEAYHTNPNDYNDYKDTTRNTLYSYHPGLQANSLINSQYKGLYESSDYHQQISQKLKPHHSQSKSQLIQQPSKFQQSSKKQQKSKKIEEKHYQGQKQKQPQKIDKTKQKNVKDAKQTKKDIRNSQKPKYPLSPYFRFLKAFRSSKQYVTEFNSKSDLRFTLQMGRRWRQMPQKQKQQYVAPYLKDKKRFDREIKEFYEKYPDLSPKYKPKKIKKVYGDNYKHLQNESELEEDILEQNHEAHQQDDPQEEFTPQVTSEERQFTNNDQKRSSYIQSFRRSAMKHYPHHNEQNSANVVDLDD